VNVADARDLARKHLEHELPKRWLHVQAVAATAARLGETIGWGDLAVRAAWLHDIGYAADLVEVGFHPLDGARALRRLGWPDDVVGLVAHHSAAVIEARMRGLTTEFRSEFEDVESVDRDVLWVADATTGPDGQLMTVADRVSDVIARYGAGSLVGQCMREAPSHLDAAVNRLVQAGAVVVGQPM